MTDHHDPHRPLDEDGALSPTAPNLFGVAHGQLAKRRRKILDEIERNRRGEYRIPTWVLALCLVVLIAAWAAWIIFG